MTENKIPVVDILSEFFEVAVHNIIYVRKLYPDTIFVPKKKYGVTVYQAIHPGIRDYIKNCLKAVAFHCSKKQLKRLFVCFECRDTVLEKFIFDVLDITESCESDVFLVELEQSLRNLILSLHSSQIYLNELTPEATFSIQLQTSFSSNVEFNEDPVYEDFPWIEEKQTEENAEDSVGIVPLYTVETQFLKLQMYVEK